jgi:hypothetical protein
MRAMKRRRSDTTLTAIQRRKLRDALTSTNTVLRAVGQFHADINGTDFTYIQDGLLDIDWKIREVLGLPRRPFLHQDADKHE